MALLTGTITDVTDQPLALAPLYETLAKISVLECSNPVGSWVLVGCWAGGRFNVKTVGVRIMQTKYSVAEMRLRAAVQIVFPAGFCFLFHFRSAC